MNINTIRTQLAGGRGVKLHQAATCEICLLCFGPSLKESSVIHPYSTHLVSTDGYIKKGKGFDI
jgi:hypothetical protein